MHIFTSLFVHLSYFLHSIIHLRMIIGIAMLTSITVSIATVIIMIIITLIIFIIVTFFIHMIALLHSYTLYIIVLFVMFWSILFAGRLASVFSASHEWTCPRFRGRRTAALRHQMSQRGACWKISVEAKRNTRSTRQAAGTAEKFKDPRYASSRKVA